jgi:D-galacturonate reductase
VEKSKNKLNIVVIGTGMFSTGRGTGGYGTVLPAINEWQRNNNIEVKTIFVGTNGSNTISLESKAKKLAKDTGVNLDISFMPSPGVKDNYAYKSIIKGVLKPACAIIAVPDHLHYQVARDCLLEDLPILVVKPLTPTVKEGKELIKISEDRLLYSAVEFHKRWDKANLMMKDTIQKNRIGDLLYCWVEYSQRKSIPTEIFKAWTEKTSILQYLGIHYIDIVRFATNAIPKRVMAVGQKNWLPSQGLDAYDSIQCFIEWTAPNGSNFTQTILTNWIDPESSSSMSDQKIKVVGTKGRFESDQKDRGVQINIDDFGIEQPNPYFCSEYGNKPGEKEWRGYGIDSVTEFLSDVTKINSGSIDWEFLKAGRPTFSEALISTSVVEAAHESLTQDNIWKKVEL